ncbi:DUF5329 domain-containing protein [uncultured Aquitalea sp.]|uniref:DUF5329 domain-containing protein n=1 Tax=uncultured Aquitalea sp. TaxID=540272 RepID=UPI0025D36345|nr:DUF5329 domain-containing protein [uncultured Aquitalea sp.]
MLDQTLLEGSMLKKQFWYLGALIVLPLVAEAMPEGVPGKEINFLLGKIGQSNCKFERSGSWYDAATAVDHLKMKLDKAGDRVKTTEDFIQGVASKSYLSGKPYHLACPGQPVMESGVWLNAALKQYRQSH